MINNVGVGLGLGSGSSSNGGGLKKGPWSAGEDAVLIDYVRKHGEGNWNAVQRNTGLQRCGKSCRLRWANHLRPNLKKGAFSHDEEKLIIELHSKLGNKWARISAHLPGRTDNEIKNYWNTRVKRRIRQGLPLYPNDVQVHNPQPQQPPLAPLPLHETRHTVGPTLPLFDPVSLSSSLFTLHHAPPFLSTHPLKRLTPFLGRTVSSPSQLGPCPSFQTNNPVVGFSFGSCQSRGFGSGLGLVRCGSSSFDSLNYCSELPSNQHSQKVTDHEELDEREEKAINTTDVARTNSGLLDDLLHEARDKICGGNGFKRMKLDQWDASSSENSSTEIKKEKPEVPQSNSKSEDLSNILELIPSLVRVPTWCSDGGRESSVGQSSVVSADDNYNGLDDQLPQLSPFPTTVSTNDYENSESDWSPGCYAWDNLPKIC